MSRTFFTRAALVGTPPVVSGQAWTFDPGDLPFPLAAAGVKYPSAYNTPAQVVNDAPILLAVRLFCSFADGFVSPYFEDAPANTSTPAFRFWIGDVSTPPTSSFIEWQFPTLNEWYDVNMAIPVLNRVGNLDHLPRCQWSGNADGMSYYTHSISPAWDGIRPSMEVQALFKTALL